MGTEVLRPQDCFVERIRISPPAGFPRRRSFYNHLNNTSCGRQAYHHPKPTTRKPVIRSSELQSKKKQIASESVRTISKRSSSEDLKSSSTSTSSSKNLLTGQVQILRRGESLDSKVKSSESSSKKNEIIVSGTERLGPDPEMMSKQVRIKDSSSRPPSPPNNNVNNKQFLSPVAGGLYAGSAFAVSPSPDSLPLPSFSKKKQASKIVDDSATRDLRRLLRLD